jgi:hypothetical protein
MPTTLGQHRPTVKALLNSSNPPASPLDALVMALEATVKDEGEDRHSIGNVSALGQELTPKDEVEEEDPDATIPSSPTMFMRQPPTGSSSLHHLPTIILPGPAVLPSHSSSSTTMSCTSSSETSLLKRTNQRKLSLCSQDSSVSSSSSSNGECRKEYVCTIGDCEKKFQQLAHFRSHER